MPNYSKVDPLKGFDSKTKSCECGHEQSHSPHTHNSANPVLCKPHAKYQPGLSFNLFFIVKKHHVGVVLIKPHLYAVCNA